MKLLQRFFSSAPASSRRRVVVTGLGAICPLGQTVSEAWSKLVSGASAISRLPDELYGKLPCRIAAQLSNFDASKHFSNSDLRTMSPATSYALIAAAEALTEANWSQLDPERTGVAVGVGMIDLQDVCETYEALKQRGYNRVSPFFVPRILPNMAAGQISMKYGLQGPNHSVSTACATGAHSIGDAFRFIQHGDADAMVCGGAEASVSPLSIAGFCRLRALSTQHNDAPERASRPFDNQRDGFVMGEGSAIVVLEELEHAKARGATIHAEILGYGLSGDASHLTAPREDGRGATLVMKRTLQDAGVRADEVGYVNAHATSTPVGDVIEARAVKNVFQANSVAISSTKGAHGHLLGAAGNLEAIFTILAVREGLIPPTINFEATSDEIKDLNFVPNEAQKWERNKGRRVALKNSFGFGGTNACLCIAEFVE